MTQLDKIKGHLHFDEETNTYIATSDDVPGLVIAHNDPMTAIYLAALSTPEMLELNEIDRTINSETIFSFTIDIPNAFGIRRPQIMPLVTGSTSPIIEIVYSEALRNKHSAVRDKETRIERLRSAERREVPGQAIA